MKTNINFEKFPWIGAGVSMFLFVLLVVLNFQAWQNQKQFALKSKRMDLVAQMRLTLTSASEAEKSAVLAITDKDSQTFADQSKAATVELDREHKELSGLLIKAGTKYEKDLLEQFSKAFADLKQIDNNLLALAVKNTNLKAYDLAFGPAADTLKEMYTSLSNLVSKNAGSPNSEKVMLFAFGAQTAALHLQTLLAPHIAEENNKKMDDLESLMTKDDQKVSNNLAALASLPVLHDDLDLKNATLNYTKFSELRGRILRLSRENTNILSLAESLGHKRNVLLQCQELLFALQQAIQNEQISDVDNEPVPNPRSLQIEK